MKRYYPFALAILGTTLALGLTFLVVRMRATAPKPPKGALRRAVGRIFEGFADQMEEEAHR